MARRQAWCVYLFIFRCDGLVAGSLSASSADPMIGPLIESLRDALLELLIHRLIGALIHAFARIRPLIESPVRRYMH